MTVRRPHRLKVGPYTYTVLAVPDRVIPDEDAHWDGQKQQITINATSHPETQLISFTHELLHALCALGMGTYPDPKIEKLEERFVGILAPHLLAALRDNPALVAWLTRPLKTV